MSASGLEPHPAPAGRPHSSPAPDGRRKIRWGVIGSGGIARRRTIPEGLVGAEHAELAAVFNRSRETNTEVAQTFHARDAATLDELLQDDVDAVYLASPPDAHLAQTLACAAAGKHVLCEKPLATSPADAATMAAACRAAGVRLGTALMMRFHAQHRAARELIAAGRLGRPVLARAQLSCWYPPIDGAWRQDPARSGGGSLMDLGGHCLDLLEFFFGPIRALSCTTARIAHAYPVEDAAIVSAEFASGALGIVDAFFCIPDESSRNVLELYGSAGSIHASGTIGQGASGTMAARLGGGGGYDAGQQREPVTDSVIAPLPVNLYRAEIEEFSRAVREGRDPENNAELGVRSQRLLAACYESARSGRRVEVSAA